MRTGRTFTIVCLWVCVPLAALRAAETAPATPESLVKQLGADSFEERNAAESKLIELGLASRPAVEAGLKSDDPEIQNRAVHVLAQLWDVDARENEAAWAQRIGAGLGALQLHDAPAGPEPGPANEKKTVKPMPSPQAAALKWLARTQEPDGHWDSKKFGADDESDLAQTAMALLGFLGAGHTEKVGLYKENVRRAVAWLMKQQRSDGAFCKKNAAVDGLTHAMCGLALAEASGMARRPGTADSAQRALDYTTGLHQTVVDGKKSGFGRAKNSKAPDTFSTTLFVLQLKSGKVAQLNIPRESFDGVIQFLDSVQNVDAKTFRLRPGEPDSPQLSLMGCLARQFLGWKKDDLAETVVAAMKHYGPPASGADNSDDFTNWIGTLAVFQQGGAPWREWQKTLLPTIAASQLITGDDAGSWPAKGRWAGAGRVLSTSLNLLTVTGN